MNDRLVGYVVLFGSLLGIAVYFYLMFLSPWIVLVIQVSAFVAVASVLVIIAWIGYTLIATPPPMPMEDFEEPSIEEEKEEDAKI